MSFRYLLLGAGRQGIAAAYDVGRFGAASEILVGDVREEAATSAAARLNALLGRAVAAPLVVNAADPASLQKALSGMDGCINSVHYTFNLELTRLAIETGVCMTDLGGHTGVVRQQLELDDAARRAGATIVPDCGMGPGLNISLATYVMDLLDEAEDVRIWDGGLPQDPEPPWNYALTFNIAGLTNEYAGSATFIRDSVLTEVPCFEDLEAIEFPGLGTLEAFVTSGGLSTAPWTFNGRLRRLENKTLRYPGHAALWKAYVALGLLDTAPVEVGGARVVPRDVLHALLAPRITREEVRDVCAMRVRADGRKEGKPAAAVVELLDRFDPQTGFTAMQRLTGWHASIMLIAAVTRQVGAGVIPVERALPGAAVVDEVLRRGFDLRSRVGAPEIVTAS